jgi:hypothetical protein
MNCRADKLPAQSQHKQKPCICRSANAGFLYFRILILILLCRQNVVRILINGILTKKENPRKRSVFKDSFKADGRNRTDNLLITNQYQRVATLKPQTRE